MRRSLEHEIISPVGIARRIRVLGIAALLLGCDAEGAPLVVDVLTNYRVGDEVDAVIVSVHRAGSEEAFAERGPRPLGATSGPPVPLRAAEIDALPRGDWRIEVRLTRAGEEVGRGRVRLTSDADARSVTVIVTRECEGVSCPGPSDDPSATACLAGACVDARCSPESPETCPIDCAADGACPAGDPPCLQGLCVAGRCATFADDTACAGGTCDRTLGCLGGNADAGPLDAGPLDGGAGDAGVDGGPATEELDDATDVATGNDHSCAIVTGGRVRCWGQNDFGQLGDGTTTDRSLAVEVVGLDQVSALALGDFHSCALRLGEVHCWGDNEYGQLGSGLGVDSLTPVRITGVASVSAITAGDDHTCALSAVDARCWGRGSGGQLGQGDRTVINPSPGGYEASGPLQAIEGAREQTCALLATGAVECAGINFYGQHADGTEDDHDSPAPTGYPTDAIAIGAGFDHTCVVRAGGDEVQCAGRNAAGELGDGTTTDSTTPVVVTGVADVIQLAVGAQHSCVRSSGVGIRCWGSNAFGQLGDGTTSPRTEAVTVPSTGAAQDVDCGRRHCCALGLAGRVHCWGSNEHGQLGDGTNTDRLSLVPVLR